MADDRAVRALLQAGLKLARSTASGRLAFAQAHALTDPAAVPEHLRAAVMAELDAAAADVRPVAAGDVAKALQRAWGDKPHTLVDDLDLDSPLAVTAGAQVHAASYDGEPVAVKLLRPGIAELVRSDLALLDTLSAPARSAFPAVDVGALLREARDRVMDELDLEHGAAAQRAFARGLRRDDAIAVPAVISDLTRHDVIVSAHVPGRTLAQSLPTGDAAHALSGELLRFFVGGARSIGVVHADADPANVILTGAGIAVVDFGATAQVGADLLDAAIAALQALRDGDGAAFADAVVGRLGLLPDAASAATAMAFAREVAGDLLTGPAQLDGAAMLAVSARVRERREVLLGLSAAATLKPEHLGPLRMLATLTSTLARLGVTRDWIADGIKIAQEGWKPVL